MATHQAKPDIWRVDIRLYHGNVLPVMQTRLEHSSPTHLYCLLKGYYQEKESLINKVFDAIVFLILCKLTLSNRTPVTVMSYPK